MNNNGVTNNTNQTVSTTVPNTVPVAVTPQVQQQQQPVPATQPVNQPTIVSIETIIPNAAELQAQQPQVVVPQTQPVLQQQVQPQQPVISNEPMLIPMTEPPQQIIRSVEVRKSKLTPILLVAVLVLVAYIIYTTKTNQTQINNLIYKCTPVNATKEEKELDTDSTLVKNLYNIVKTNIREDVAQTDYNDTYKAYLVLRQMSKSSFYDSNCNMFNNSGMEPYKCDGIQNFHPMAFTEDDYILKWKEIYGENSKPYLGNIKLKNECIGGYQYIPERHEFVEGSCDKQSATSYKVTKTIKKAVTTRNTIIITEEVRYKENEGLTLPDYLKNGYYIYTFRLDINYNYVLVSKEYQSKY